MTNVPALFRKEISSYFLSPIAYIVIAVFLVYTGFFFSTSLFENKIVSLKYSVMYIQFILPFLVPIITMRLFSEETKSGTIETLMTAPVSDFEVVIGKFLAAFGLYCVMIFSTLIYVVFLSWVGDPDYGSIITSYIGLLLMGSVYISVGLLTSAVTKNQIIAAVIGIVGLLFLLVIGLVHYMVGEGFLSECFKYIGTFDHWETFTKGLVDSRDIIYYISLTVLLLFITIRVVESRKWR
ncbi:MAG: ABC transporter permease [Candidatus Anammoxibacter sp.]